MGIYCSGGGPFHGAESFRNRLLQHWYPAGHKSFQQNCSRLGFSLHRILTGLCSNMDFPQGHSLLQVSTCSNTEQSSRGDLCSTVDLHRLQGNSCLATVFTTGCRGTCAILSPFSLTLVSEELFLSHILAPLFGCNCAHLGFFFSF